MGKEVTRNQAVGWALPVVTAVAGSLIAAYVMVREHEYRLGALEKTQEQQFSKLDNIELQLQNIKNSATRIETILEEQEKQRGGGGGGGRKR